jgi:cell division septum initiation protein DivIVA
MAKKDKKSAKKKEGRDPSDVVEAVRGAVERTIQGGPDGGRGLLDDVASAAQRIRESFDDLRVLEDVRGLRTEVEALSRRVAELEKQAAKPAAATTSAAKPAAAPKPAAARRTSTPRKAPAKPSAARTAAAKTGPKPKPAPKSGD